MIDTHCHIDQYPNPILIARECEKQGIITIGMTNLPSHFELGYKHLLTFKKVRLALGMHPLLAPFNTNEFSKFESNLHKTSYIGEIGLDYSKEGMPSKEIQTAAFIKILSALKGKNKLLSLHSRKAEEPVLQLLIDHEIKNAIFHWYSGPLPLIDKIVQAGYFFSVNTAMIKSKNGKEIIKRIPKEKLLTESDGPFIEFGGKAVTPSDIKFVEDYLVKQWNSSNSSISEIINQNFKRIISNLS